MPDTAPPAESSPSPEEAGQRYAQEKRIDPAESYCDRILTEQEATGLAKTLDKSMPIVASVYEPSGKVSNGGYVYMLVGAVVGVATTVVGLAVSGALAAIIFVPGIWLLVYFIEMGCMRYFSWLILIPAILIALVVPFIVAALTGSLPVIVASDRGRSRSVETAELLSIFACAVGIVGFWFCFHTYMLKPMKASLFPDFRDENVVIWVHGIFLVGCGITLYGAKTVSSSHVAGKKFCEACEEPMAQAQLKQMCLGGTRLIVQALSEEKLAVAASLLHSPTGSEGEVLSFSCPKCKKGILEVSLSCSLAWQSEKEKGTKKFYYRVASMELSPEESESFRSYQGSTDPRAEPPAQS